MWSILIDSKCNIWFNSLSKHKKKIFFNGSWPRKRKRVRTWWIIYEVFWRRSFLCTWRNCQRIKHNKITLLKTIKKTFIRKHLLLALLKSNCSCHVNRRYGNTFLKITYLLIFWECNYWIIYLNTAAGRPLEIFEFKNWLERHVNSTK